MMCIPVSHSQICESVSRKRIILGYRSSEHKPGGIEQMRKSTLVFVAAFVLAIACGGASTPDTVVRQAIDAVVSGDGEALVGYLSSDGIEALNGQVEELKANPEESASFLAMMGIDVTAEEVENMDAGDMITWMLQSELMQAELPDFSTIEIGEPVIEGEDALVPIVLEGESEEVELVLEDGEWKLSEMMGM
ncbi:MAG: hypothetical protein KAR44_02235 [Candidatus Aegiribacteria sp.]|nr:hypothetical protein [Candidatus Aegiribacteria sp.]